MSNNKMWKAPARATIAVIVAITIGAMAMFAQPLRAQSTTPACEARGSRDSLASRPSPLDSATVTVGARQVKVCYSRPSARGRVIFGQLVPYGEPWRTGANEPTMLFLPDTMEIAGVRLGPGRIILRTIPEREEWTLLFHTTTEKDPERMARSLDEVGRATVPARTITTPVEQFTIRPDSARGAAALVLEWERTQVLVPIRPVGARR
jgi:hypothetical protein